MHPGRCWIYNSHTFAHPTVQNASIDLSVHPGKLDPIINTFGLPRILDKQRGHPLPGLAYHGGYVAEIQLTLIVRRCEFSQRSLQSCGVEDIDSRIDLGDLTLHLIGVSMLDDAAHHALGVAQDSPVPGRIRNLGGKYGDHRLSGPVLGEQRGKSLAGEHRNVAIGDDDVTIEICQLPERDLNRMAGTKLLLLHRYQHMWRDLREMFLHLITKMTDDDHDMLRLQGSRGRDRVAEHGVTSDLVQQLGTRRLHPLPLPRRQDDDSRDRAGGFVGVNGQQLAPY